jgi:hypothetical protein
MGSVVVVKIAALALEGPLEEAWSGAFRVVTFGTELVVVPLGGSPGWKEETPTRPTLLVPFFVGDRELVIGSLYCGDVTADRTSPPPIGISPEVGVGKE